MGIQVEMNNKMQNLSDKMDKLSKANGEGMAYTWRYRILRFNDEIIQEVRHTKEHFDQILEDIDNYEKFCKENPDFPNNKAVLAIKNIKDCLLYTSGKYRPGSSRSSGKKSSADGKCDSAGGFRGCPSGRKCRCSRKTWNRASWNRTEIRCRESVSYTHLDVYKRQQESTVRPK